MTARQVLADLESRGIELRAEGGRLRFRPPEALTPAVAGALRMHRPELLTLLRTRQVLGMPLSAFATAGLRLVVYSELLGERVIFASDNARLPPADRERVVYRAAELRELLGLGPAELRRVHLVKGTFKELNAQETADLAATQEPGRRL